jgi:hypothetical protein
VTLLVTLIYTKKKGILAILSELPVNSQNKPIKAGTGNLTSDSEFFSHNPLYRSFLSFKTWHIFLDFNRSFLGIIGDNPRKIANIP